LDEFQDSVVDCPLSTADGDALREIVGAGEGGAGGVGGASFVTAGGVVCTFLWQPVPEIIEASRISAAAPSVYNDFLIAVSP
jgi:hypothetical protein